MKNQIIKLFVDNFEDFIKENLQKENDYYVYNYITFKKLEYDGKLVQFLETLKPCYYKNKHYYIERHPMTFNQFNTVLRQICKRNNIKFNSNIKYNSSKYSIEYFIYFDN
jgi:hypothetical protein